MATLVELKAKAKKMGYKGYSKMKKAELVNLLTTPPPKPPRTKSKAEQAKNPVRQVQPAKKGAEAVPYSKISRRKNSDGIPIIDVPDSLIIRVLQVLLDSKSPYFITDGRSEEIRQITKQLKSNFSRMNRGQEFTPQVWNKKWNTFIDEEQENIKKQVKKL